MSIWQTTQPTYCEDCYIDLPARKSGQPRRFCEECRATRYHPESEEARNTRLLREALNEIAPFGLTDECPARKALS